MDYTTGQLGDREITAMLENPETAPSRLNTGKDPMTEYADDGKEISAVCFGFRRHHDDTYLLYGYRFKDREYGFLWETYFDEAQRASGGGEPRVWYDDVREGDVFPVRIRLKDPRQHVVLEGPFTGINDSEVITLP